MSAPKFTQGPYAYDGKHITGPDYAPGHPVLVADLVPHRYGSADRRPFDPERLANAALLSSAPDLFAASSDALAYLDSLPDAQRGSIAEVAQCAARYALRAALSKANPASK